MWADNLIEEYRTGRKGLRSMKEKLNPEIEEDSQDSRVLNSMMDSMAYSIDWMESGRQPDVYRGIDKRNAYRAKQYDEIDIIPDITEQLEREPLYISQEQRHTLLKLFRNFSDRERQCYIMHEAEQLSMKKISERLGISKSSVQMYIKRAKEKVQLVAS